MYLCYEIHGDTGKIYNLVSDTCVSINAEYMGITNDTNFIAKVSVLAVDINGVCQNMTIDALNCTGMVGLTEVMQNFSI